ncbi:MAG TPA: nucleotidyltransferase family protein [Dehalococcoidia bacterium]|nr:nucleotidyltransferase family protein [Dehalococcoidia bacterium]
MTPRRVAAILLAAGESRRMGKPKPLLDWQGTNLIEYQIAQLRAAGCDPLIAVLGHGAADVAVPAGGAGAVVAVNEGYRAGRASSLRTGANAIDAADAIVVLSVDQPRPAAVIRRLIDEHAGGVTMPAHGGRRGHPVVLDGALLGELRAAREETEGLRAIVGRQPAREVTFDTAIVLLDLNTPEEYEEASRIFASEVPQ